MLSRLGAIFQRSRFGIAAQLFTFAAGVIPIVCSKFDAVIFLVSSGALVTICMPLFTLVVAHTLPVVTGRVAVLGYLKAVAVCSGLGSVLLALASYFFYMEVASSQQPFESALAIGMLSFGQAVFVVSVAELTRRLSYQGVMQLRFGYGAFSLLLTLLLVVIDADVFWYVMAVGASYILAVLTAMLFRSRSSLRYIRQIIGARLRDGRATVRSIRTMVPAIMVGTFAGQLTSLITPLLGEFSGAWATAVRVSSGFQSVGSQIIGVDADLKVAASMRDSGGRSIEKVIKRLLLTSTSFGVVGAIVTFVAVLWFSDLTNLSTSDALILLCCVFAFVFAQVAVSPLSRLLGFLGRKERSIWDVVRAAIGAIILMINLSPMPMLIIVTVFTLAVSLSYGWLLSLSGTKYELGRH